MSTYFRCACVSSCVISSIYKGRSGVFRPPTAQRLSQIFAELARDTHTAFDGGEASWQGCTTSRAPSLKARKKQGIVHQGQSGEPPLELQLSVLAWLYRWCGTRPSEGLQRTELKPSLLAYLFMGALFSGLIYALTSCPFFVFHLSEKRTGALF
jgi:hypothetical protein